MVGETWSVGAHVYSVLSMYLVQSFSYDEPQNILPPQGQVNVKTKGQDSCYFEPPGAEIKKKKRANYFVIFSKQTLKCHRCSLTRLMMRM